MHNSATVLHCALHIHELRFNACGLAKTHLHVKYLKLYAKLVAINNGKKIQNCSQYKYSRKSAMFLASHTATMHNL